MDELELEPESHTYSLGGVTIPGCTQVLTAMGASRGFGFLKPDELRFYQTRGQAGHKAVELSVRGTLDKRTLPRIIKPYLIGFERFCNDYDFQVLIVDGEPFTERRLHHPVFRYGVTPDLAGTAKKLSVDPSTFEVKLTSAHAPATGLQLSAQRLAIKTVVPEIGDGRFGLRLLPVEPYYDLKRYTERSDEAVWISLLNGYNWRQRHNLL